MWGRLSHGDPGPNPAKGKASGSPLPASCEYPIAAALVTIA